MKKGIVALLVLLALIVLLSPVMVGRWAEKSIDENLQWAAQESREPVVTLQAFDRGWFSSEGQHRVAVRESPLQALLLALAGADDGALPALIVNTRLDHGLIAVSSMSREGGTLMPGLGSALSTLSVELPHGKTVELPGVIHSTVGLLGEIQSNYTLEPGTTEIDDVAAVWGAVDIDVTTNPVSGSVAFAGLIEPLEITGDTDRLQVGAINFSGDQRRSPFGFMVGDVIFTMDSMTFQGGADDAVKFGAMQNAAGGAIKVGPISIDSTTSVDGDRVTGRSTLRIDRAHWPWIGDVSIAADISVINFDGAAAGKLRQTLENMPPGGSPEQLYAAAEKDAQDLFAKGLELRIDRLDIELPQGPVTSQFSFVVAASDRDQFSWTAALLALDATADLRVPAELVDLAIMMSPEASAAIAMGFLKKNGEFYETKAVFKKMLLTINGAPLPIPLPGAP